MPSVGVRSWGVNAVGRSWRVYAVGDRRSVDAVVVSVGLGIKSVIVSFGRIEPIIVSVFVVVHRSWTSRRC